MKRKNEDPHLRKDGFPKPGGVALIDLDGTMAFYKGWKGYGKAPGRVLPGVRQTIRRLQKEGHQVLVWTARVDKRPVRKWIKDNKIPVDGIWMTPKPVNLTVIIDDRAHRAEGSLDPETVYKAMRPWWKDQVKI